MRPHQENRNVIINRSGVCNRRLLPHSWFISTVGRVIAGRQAYERAHSRTHLLWRCTHAHIGTPQPHTCIDLGIVHVRTVEWASFIGRFRKEVWVRTRAILRTSSGHLSPTPPLMGVATVTYFCHSSVGLVLSASSSLPWSLDQNSSQLTLQS